MAPDVVGRPRLGPCILSALDTSSVTVGIEIEDVYVDYVEDKEGSEHLLTVFIRFPFIGFLSLLATRIGQNCPSPEQAALPTPTVAAMYWQIGLTPP